PEAGAEDAVGGQRGAAALDVAEHGDAGVEPGAAPDLRGHRLAHGAGDDLAVAAVLRLPLHRGALGGHGALGDDDDGERGVGPVPVLEAPGDLVDVERGLGGEDDLRSPGDPGLDGDPPGLPAHELDDHDPVVALRSGVDPVDRLGGDVHGRVEADGAVGAGDVVADRLGDGGARHTGLRDRARRVEGAVTADADQAVDPLRLQRGVDRLQAALNGVRVVARRAQQGATGVEDPA